MTPPHKAFTDATTSRLTAETSWNRRYSAYTHHVDAIADANCNYFKWRRETNLMVAGMDKFMQSSRAMWMRMKALLIVLAGILTLTAAYPSRAGGGEPALTDTPSGILDKCKSGHCRLFETPFGTYRIDDPAKETGIEQHFENIRLGNDPDHSSHAYLLDRRTALEMDMLRAGCIDIIHSDCSENTFFIDGDCGSDFNFGSSKLGACASSKSKFLLRPAISRSECARNGRPFKAIDLFSPKIATDLLSKKYFDASCIGWRNSGHDKKLTIQP